MLLSVYNIYKRFPLETLIIAAMIAIAVIGVILYVGQLVMIGWIVDFLSGIGVPKFRAKPVPLEYDRAGEIIVVRLRDNVATAAQCLSVERQLKRLIEEQHCDFILDFLAAGNVSRSFRGVMLRSMKAARREAERLGKPYRPLDLPRGGYVRGVCRQAVRGRSNVPARRTWVDRPVLCPRGHPGSLRTDVKEIAMTPRDGANSQDAFARLVIERLREVGVTGEISYDSEEFQVTVAGEKESVLFLNNAYQEYCAARRSNATRPCGGSCGAGCRPTSRRPRNMPTFSPTSCRQCARAASSSRPACEW